LQLSSQQGQRKTEGRGPSLKKKKVGRKIRKNTILWSMKNLADQTSIEKPEAVGVMKKRSLLTCGLSTGNGTASLGRSCQKRWYRAKTRSGGEGRGTDNGRAAPSGGTKGKGRCNWTEADGGVKQTLLRVILRKFARVLGTYRKLGYNGQKKKKTRPPCRVWESESPSGPKLFWGAMGEKKGNLRPLFGFCPGEQGRARINPLDTGFGVWKRRGRKEFTPKPRETEGGKKGHLGHKKNFQRVPNDSPAKGQRGVGGVKKKNRRVPSHNRNLVDGRNLKEKRCQ